MKTIIALFLLNAAVCDAVSLRPSQNGTAITPTSITTTGNGIIGGQLIVKGSATVQGYDANGRSLYAAGGIETGYGVKMASANIVGDGVTLVNTSSYTVRIADPNQAHQLLLGGDTNSQRSLIAGNNGLDLFTWNAGWGSRVTLLPSGNVGIGTTAPSDKLRVEGGNISTTGQGIFDSSVTVKGKGDFGDEIRAGGGITFGATGARKCGLGGTGGTELMCTLGGSLFTGYGFLTDTSLGLRVIAGGNVGIGTVTPQTTLDVNGNAQFGSGATKSTFTATGDLLVHGTFIVTGSSAPAHQPSVASASYIGIATMTVTGMRGSRTALITLAVNTVNGSGASRDYTFLVTRNGVTLDDEHVQTNAGTSSEMMSYSLHDTSTVAGTVTYCINVKSSSATGTQTARDIHLTAQEF